MPQPRHDPHRRNDGFAQAKTRGRSSCSPSKRHSPQRSDVDFWGGSAALHSVRKICSLTVCIVQNTACRVGSFDAHVEPRPQIADTPTVAFADGKYDPVNRVVCAKIRPTRVETLKVSPVVSRFVVRDLL